MELRYLSAFVTLAEELNFRRAAERMRMAQSPLSQQIKRLEREVGVALLRRTTRQVALTAAGEAFLTEARRALAAAEAAPRAARQAAAGRIGLVRLGFTGPASYEVLLLLARAFRRQYPDVRLDIAGPAYSGELVGLLHRGTVDAALVRTPVPAGGLRIREITRHAIVAAVPAGHPLAGEDTVTMAQLADHPLIGYPSGRGAAIASVVRGAFTQHELNPDISQEAPDTHTIMLLAGAGTGIGLVPASAAHLKVPGVVVVPVRDLRPVALALAWLADSPNPALGSLTGLIDEVRSECTPPDAEQTRAHRA